MSIKRGFSFITETDQDRMKVTKLACINLSDYTDALEVIAICVTEVLTSQW